MLGLFRFCLYFFWIRISMFFWNIAKVRKSRFIRQESQQFSVFSKILSSKKQKYKYFCVVKNTNSEIFLCPKLQHRKMFGLCRFLLFLCPKLQHRKMLGLCRLLPWFFWKLIKFRKSRQKRQSPNIFLC